MYNIYSYVIPKDLDVISYCKMHHNHRSLSLKSIKVSL